MATEFKRGDVWKTRDGEHIVITLIDPRASYSVCGRNLKKITVDLFERDENISRRSFTATECWTATGKMFASGFEHYSDLVELVGKYERGVFVQNTKKQSTKTKKISLDNLYE